MRQRNPGPAPLLVPSIPIEVPPGEVIDHPDLITGFEPVEDIKAVAPPAQDSADTARKAKAKTTATTEEA